MEKLLQYKILFLSSLLFIFFVLPFQAKAVTEFVSSIQQSGGDYSTLTSWEASIQSDIATSSARVYSGTGTGSLSQGNVLELFRGGTYQNATSSLVATTSNQISHKSRTSSLVCRE